MPFPVLPAPLTWRVRTADARGRVSHGRACPTRDGAIASVSPFDDATVLAIVCSTGAELLAPQSGLAFRMAHLDAIARVLGVGADTRR